MTNENLNRVIRERLSDVRRCPEDTDNLMANVRHLIEISGAKDADLEVSRDELFEAERSGHMAAAKDLGRIISEDATSGKYRLEWIRLFASHVQKAQDCVEAAGLPRAAYDRMLIKALVQEAGHEFAAHQVLPAWESVTRVISLMKEARDLATLVGADVPEYKAIGTTLEELELQQAMHQLNLTLDLPDLTLDLGPEAAPIKAPPFSLDDPSSRWSGESQETLLIPDFDIDTYL